MVKTRAFCLCHEVRVTFTIDVDKVAEIVSGVRQGFHFAVSRILVLFKGLLLFFCSFAHVMSARCLLSSRPEIGSIRSCLFVATRILRHVGGWHSRQKPCVFLLLVLLDWVCT